MDSDASGNAPGSPACRSSELLGFPPEARVLIINCDDFGMFTWPIGRAVLLARARPDEVEREFRAQIDAVADAGLVPTHLDFHCLADGGREDILDLTTALAAEYGLAVRGLARTRAPHDAPAGLAYY